MAALERFTRTLRTTLRRRDRPSMAGPNYLHLFTLARELRTLLRDQGGLTLDLGADESPYRSFVGRGNRYIRLDFNTACRPDIAADIVRLPVRSGTIDLVICTQAAE